MEDTSCRQFFTDAHSATYHRQYEALRAIFVDALHEDAARYWQRHGFRPLRDDPLTLYMRMDDVRATIANLGS